MSREPSRINRLAAVLIVLSCVPALAAAQALRIEAPGGARSIEATRAPGFVAYRTEALTALGADVRVSGGRAVAVLFGDSMVFSAYSPFFRWGGRVVQLAQPVTLDREDWLFPRELFVDWLPVQYRERVALRDGALRLSGPVAVGSVSTTGDVARTEPAPARARMTPAEPAARGVSQPVAAPSSEAARPLGTPVARRLVVVDAGHGGKDPGTIGPNGVREKDVVLSLAQKVAAQLRTRGYEVVMTRESDVLIPRGERPRIANKLKPSHPAALFLSIHANSHPNSAATGFETFFLAEARTDDERRVAELENTSGGYVDEAPVGDGIDQILRGLRNDYYQHASNALAETIQGRMARVHGGPNRGVKQAPFTVLIGAVMPAVLFEAGFLSNPAEARNLTSAAYQQKLAYALADAVDAFFAEHEHLLMAEARP